MENFSRKVSPNLQRLIESMLVIDPIKRAHIEDVLVNKWCEDHMKQYIQKNDEINFMVKKKKSQVTKAMQWGLCNFWKSSKINMDNECESNNGVNGLDLAGVRREFVERNTREREGSFMKRNFSAPLTRFFKSAFLCMDRNGEKDVEVAYRKKNEKRRDEVKKCLENTFGINNNHGFLRLDDQLTKFKKDKEIKEYRQKLGSNHN